MPKLQTQARTIAPAILEKYPDLNDAQREVVAHVEGPLLVVAGPGSGKTYSIVLRALNLLLLERATAKAALLDRRLLEVGKKLGSGQCAGATLDRDRLSLPKPDAKDDPEARLLARRLYGLMPRVRITDLLEEVDRWTGFTEMFGHVQTGRFIAPLPFMADPKPSPMVIPCLQHAS
jgi:hypothetical protein